MNRIIIYILTIVLSGIFSCAKERSEDDISENRFFLIFRDEIIKIKGDDLSLTALFRAPDLTSSSADKVDWELINTTKSSMLFAGEKGFLRSDIFTSKKGQIERKTWISENKNLVAFQHIYSNSSGENIKLAALYPFCLSGEQNLFDKNASYRILTQETQKNGIPEAVFPKAGKVIKSDPFLIINDSLENDNLFIGSQSFYLHLFELSLEFSGEWDELQIKSLESKCDFGGVTVPPNASRESQWVVISRGKETYRLITDYTKRTSDFHALKKPVDKPPSVYSAFYYHGLSYDEEYFKSDITAFKKDYLPFDVFQIDACWQQNYGHDFESDPRVFPSGMKWVADQIKSLGYIPGIWTAPYIVKIKSETASESVAQIIPWDGKEPVLAGTDLHFSGGGVEIKEWKSVNGVVTGTIDTPWNYPIVVTIAIPESTDKGFRTETIRIAEGDKTFSWNSNQSN